MRPWKDWLHDEALHFKKNVAYLLRIPTIKPLPLLDLYHSLDAMHKATGLGNPPWIFTGASHHAVSSIAQHFDLRKETIISEMTITAKIRTMNMAPKPGIMFEDQHQAAERMRKETKWVICHTT